MVLHDDEEKKYILLKRQDEPVSEELMEKFRGKRKSPSGGDSLAEGGAGRTLTKEELVAKIKRMGMAKDERSSGPTKKRVVGRREKTCGVCGQSGHNTRSCPESEPETDFTDDGESQEVTREAVQGLKEEGFNSVEIARKLHCRLEEVNKFWV